MLNDSGINTKGETYLNGLEIKKVIANLLCQAAHKYQLCDEHDFLQQCGSDSQLTTSQWQQE